jgi:maltose-binding protein MalE
MNKMFIKAASLAAAAALTVGAFAAPVRAQDGPTATPMGSVEGTLTVWVNLERAPIIEAAGKEFEKATGVAVRVQTMGFGDVRNNFKNAAPAGEGPDIILGAHDWIGELYTNGLLAPIELSEETLAKFDPQSIGAFNYDGKLVGMPYQVEAIAMYYNTDLVKEAPKTLEEAVALSKELVEAGTVEQGIAFPPDPYHSFPFLTGFGGGVFERDANGAYDANKLMLDSEGSIEGAKALDQLVKDGILRDGVDYGKQEELFRGGKLAMWVTGPWALNGIRESGVKYAVAKIPAMKEAARPFIGAQGFMVNAFSKNLLLAQAFLAEYMATDDAMKALYDAQPAIMAWLPVRESIEDADLAAFAESVADGLPMPAIPQMSAFWSTAGTAFSTIYQQKTDPETAMKDAAKLAREEIAKTK